MCSRSNKAVKFVYSGLSVSCRRHEMMARFNANVGSDSTAGMAAVLPKITE
jgi:hypothetical protein